MTRAHSIRTFAGTVALTLAGASALGAQAGPPLARAPRDSVPPLKKMAPPSAPPATVAPRSKFAQINTAAPADSGPRPIRRVSPPVDSLRPAPAAPTTAVTPISQPAPTPPARATAGAQLVSQRAFIVSDAPPAGATARCKDGTFVSGSVDANTCVANGGLAVRLPTLPPAPKRPAP